MDFEKSQNIPHSNELENDLTSFDDLSEEDIDTYLQKLSTGSEKDIGYEARLFLQKYPHSDKTREKIASILYKRDISKLLEYENELRIAKNEGKNVVMLEADITRLKDEIRGLKPHAGIPDRREWEGKDQFIFIESNVIKLQRLLEAWHEYKPDYILLTETSAVPYGYAIKEAWKEAYPDEVPPIFYRIESPKEYGHIVTIENKETINSLKLKTNPGGINFPILEKMELGIENYLSQRIKKDSAKVLIFDQYEKTMVPHPAHLVTHHSRTVAGIYDEIQSLYPDVEIYCSGVRDYDYDNEDLNFGRSGYPIEKKYPRVTIKRNVDHSKKEILDGNRVDPLGKRPSTQIIQDILEKGYRPVGMTIKDSERRIEALKYIKSLKEFGRLVGQELRVKLGDL